MRILMLFLRFQSTLPRGERLYPDFVICKIRISIHAPARGATIPQAWPYRPCINFNPRSREGSDSPAALYISSSYYFNPRSREGSDPHGLLPLQEPSDFNPRSREGSDPGICPVVAVYLISIHAPARGATCPPDFLSRPCDISIHAPARGATTSSGNPDGFSNNFNPRSREGSDCWWLETPRRFLYFNPRSREGSDTTFQKSLKG